MLRITIPPAELWDRNRREFVYTKEQTLQLEHSLVSLSKWESRWQKPFLSQKQLSPEETLDYIRCMTLTQNVDPDIYNYLTDQNINDVTAYIRSPMTATTFSDKSSKTGKKEIVTSELIYYWMVALQIPFECQKWHLNRLLTLIRICNIKNQPPKKRSTSDILRSNAALNAARRKQLNSKG